MVLVSVVIVNWNGRAFIGDCLNSLKKQSFKDFEVIVVDNGSFDDSCEYIRKNFPKVKVYGLKKNTGFAAGNNYGIKKAKGDYIFLLNNDTVCDKDLLKNLVQEKDSAEILGCKIYYYEPSDVIWAVASRVNKITGRASLVGRGQKDHGQYDKKIFIDQTVGCAMFINKDLFKKIGYMKDEYFLYYEETEWQTRAKKAGFKIMYVPSAKLWHKVAFSSKGLNSALPIYYLVRNHMFYIKEHWSLWLKPAAYLFSYIEALARITLYAAKRRKDFIRAVVLGVRDFNRGRSGETDAF